MTLGKSLKLSEHLESRRQFSESKGDGLSTLLALAACLMVGPQFFGSFFLRLLRLGYPIPGNRGSGLRDLGAVNPGTFGMAALPEREGTLGRG